MTSKKFVQMFHTPRTYMDLYGHPDEIGRETGWIPWFPSHTFYAGKETWAGIFKAAEIARQKAHKELTPIIFAMQEPHEYHETV